MKIKNSSNRFKQRMEELIGREAGQLMDALQQISDKSIRYNSKQCKPEELKGLPVPWCIPYGRYWEADFFPSDSIEFAAGKYYIQEASAMLAISAASQVIDFQDKIVLDLTAAPGGKATQVAELIGSGYLVANEVIKKRVQALLWNINRHRLNNVIITSLPTDYLAHALPCFFDVVIVDAPCSGEGLFQKRKHSLNKWSENNVRFCARRQTSILTDAVNLIRPGGYVIYSTCTFSKEENEDQVEFLLKNNLSPVTLPLDLPVSPAVTENRFIRSCSRRIFPHRERGAGAFVSILQKKTGTEKPFLGKYYKFKTKFPVPKSMPERFLRAEGLDGYFYESGGVTTYFSYERIPEFLQEKSLQIGAPIFDKRRTEGIMFGCVQIPAPEALLEVELSSAESYIRGEDLKLSHENGYYFITYRGMILGPVKISNGRAVNKLPAPLRRK